MPTATAEVAKIEVVVGAAIVTAVEIDESLHAMAEPSVEKIATSRSL